MNDFIYIYENAFPNDLCDDLCKYLDSNKKFVIECQYSSHNNILAEQIFLSRCAQYATADDNTKDLDNKVFKALDKVIHGPFINDILQLRAEAFQGLPWTSALGCIGDPSYDSGYELRYIKGATILHSDGGAIPDDDNSHRLLSIVVCLSETQDSIVFPFQKKEIQYKKGTVLIFPPYWLFPHYTKFVKPSYRLQTWLCTKNDRGTSADKDAIMK